MDETRESPSYDDDGDIVTRAHRCLERAKAHTATWRQMAREDFDFYAGEQWDADDLRKLEEEQRPAITFNRVAPLIDAVSGSEINNRQETRYIPREVGDAQVNEILTGAAKWVRDNTDAEDEESEAFRDALICGMGWTETRLDYEIDLDGMIAIGRVDPIEMYWDTDARKQNLSDARWLLRIKRIDKDTFSERWPDKFGLTAPGLTLDEQRRPHLADEAWEYRENGQAHIDSDAVPVSEYQWFVTTPVYRVLNPTTGQLEELTQEQFDKLGEVIERLQLPHVKQSKRVYHQAFIAGKVLLESGLSPSQTGFTYKCITGKRDRNSVLWFGLMRVMKDPQRWANKWVSQILHILNSNSKGGIIAERDAFEDPRQAEERWARPEGIVWAKAGGIGKVQPKPQTAVPAGFDRLTQFAIGSIPDVTGINMEMLGLADREQAGVLEFQRRQSALTILAPMFNALRRYRKEQGRLLLEFIQKYISDGRLIRIVGQNGQEQYVQLIKTPGTATYDVIVDQAPTSPNQREQVWSVLQGVMPMLLKIGVPIPPDILDYLPLPSSLSQKWKESLQGQQQAAQQAPPPDPRAEAEAQAVMAKGQAAQMTAQARAQAAAVDAQVKMAEQQRRDQIAAQEARMDQIKAQQDQQVTEAKVAREVLAAQNMQAEEGRAQEQHAVAMMEGMERARKAGAEADAVEPPGMIIAVAEPTLPKAGPKRPRGSRR